ncbi:AraC family transcriptional regulator [Brevundimonas sp.]|uniref:helix-turn-helix domain-containing protein n=1 Tax=Brevundimonas sp. TaxID=1871086 RepID=UPI002737CADF|nr:helix-turn-helix domain-containing protein [Brevundimonas sp.]MDP3802455.1 helix-turn-helix domain-containing protein [Brevundimonas sp.]
MEPSPPVRQQLAPRQRIPRHRHQGAYAALVLRGGYDEAGETGRRRLTAGDVAVHEMFSSHQNAVAGCGAVVLNLPVRQISAGFGRIADPDAVARLAETRPLEASRLLRATFVGATVEIGDWPDLLARDLLAGPGVSLHDWAMARGLAPETLSRGFRRAFGVTPKRFRYEAQARRAFRAVTEGQGALVEAALESGFADQSHMSRAVADLTGAPPGRWRRWSSGDKTAG